MAEHWHVQDSSYRMPRDHKPVVLYYDTTPGGQKNADGTTTFSLNIPALVVTEWVSDAENIGKQIAAELNAFPKLVKGLEAVRFNLLRGGQYEENSIMIESIDALLADVGTVRVSGGDK